MTGILTGANRGLSRWHSLAILCALLFCQAAGAATSINTWTLSFTNAAGTTNGDKVFIAGKELTWSNVMTSTLILTNSTPAGSATNLVLQLGSSPISSVTVERMTNATNVVLKGLNLVVTKSGNWGTISSDSVAGTNTWAYPLPIDNITDLSTRTNNASNLVYSAKYSNKKLGTNWPATEDVVMTGANINGGTQQIQAPKYFEIFGGSNSLGIFGGPISGTTISGSTFDSGSIGLTAETDLEQATLGSSGRIFIVGGSGTTNTISVTDSGLGMYSGRITSTPLDVTAPDDLGVLLNFWSAIRLFPNLVSGLFIGTNVWNIRNDWFGTLNWFHDQLGATNFTGIGNSLTNSRVGGTNQWAGDVAWVAGTYSSMANTNQTIPAFTNSVVYLSGSTTAHDIPGAAGGRAGLRIRYWDSGTLPLVIRNLGGGASAGNRIRTRTGNDITLTNSPAGFELEYSATAPEWWLTPLGN